MDKYVLQTNSLSKSFGRTEILHGIDMSIEYGEIYGLIGQNGAGKTTLLRLISGLMKPTKGTVNLQTGKPFIGYMPQSCRFDDNTTVSEIIRFFARLRNADTKESVFLGKKLKLDMSKKVKHLSPGQQKKLQMIIAMTGEPDLYVLDEPTAGLDPKGRDEILDQIAKLRQETGITVILVSHSMEDVAKYVERIIVMNQGSVLYDDEPREVFKHYKELEQVGLAAPQVTYIMQALAAKGIPVRTDVTTIEEAKQEILSQFL